MSVKIEQSQLARVLATAGAVVNGRSTSPILGGLLVEVRDGTFSAVGSDLFTTIRATCAADGRLDAVVAPAEIVERVKHLPPGEVAIAIEGAAIRVASGKRWFKLHFANAQDYPTVHADPATGEEVNAKDLASSIARASVAMDYDASCAYYGMHFVDGEAQSTDRKRCALIPSPLSLRCRIGADVAGHIVKFIDPTETIRAEVKGARLHITRPDATLSTALLDAEVFPRLREFFDLRKPMPTATVDRAALTSSLRALQSTAHKEIRRVTVHVTPGEMRIQALGGERGEGEDTIECETSDKFKLSCSVDYLVAALNGSDAAKVRVRFTDNYSPIIVTGSTTTQLVMPMDA